MSAIKVTSLPFCGVMKIKQRMNGTKSKKLAMPRGKPSFVSYGNRNRLKPNSAVPTFRRSWSYFGNPTSPVKNALPGGIYEFGADGGPYTTITPDQGTFDIPYQTTTPSLLL